MKHSGGERRGRGSAWARILLCAFFAAAGAGLALSGAGNSGQESAAGAGPEAEISGRAGTASDSEAVTSERDPVVWYTDSALKVYWPDSGKTVKIADLRDGGMDRLTRTYYQSTFNTADGVSVTGDGSKVFFMRNLTTDLLTGMSGELCVAETEGQAAGNEQLIASGVQKYEMLPDDRIFWVDRNGSLYLEKKETGPLKAEKVLSGVTEYRLSSGGETIFAVTDRGSGWRVSTEDGSREKEASGISSVAFATGDLRDLYYYSGSDSGQETQDLYCIHDFGNPKVVDVDVSEAAFVPKTGHVYYLRKDAAGGELRNALCYFDGEKSTEVMQGVETIDASRLSLMQRDRLIFWCGLSGNYRIYLADGGRALDTGFSLTDTGLLDFCPDATEDALYYIRQEGVSAGTLDPGNVFRKRFSEDGFGEEEKVFEGATALSVVQGGRVYAALFQENEDTPAFIADGARISDRVEKFIWDDSGLSPEIQLYRNVFREEYYVSGELDDWSGDASDPVRPIAYNVREYHAGKDGSLTMLTDYDEEEERGTLLYWDGVREPVVLDTEAQGTRKGEGEEADAGGLYGDASVK